MDSTRYCSQSITVLAALLMKNLNQRSLNMSKVLTCAGYQKMSGFVKNTFQVCECIVQMVDVLFPIATLFAQEEKVLKQSLKCLLTLMHKSQDHPLLQKNNEKDDGSKQWRQLLQYRYQKAMLLSVLGSNVRKGPNGGPAASRPRSKYCSRACSNSFRAIVTRFASKPKKDD